MSPHTAVLQAVVQAPSSALAGPSSHSSPGSTFASPQNGSTPELAPVLASVLAVVVVPAVVVVAAVVGSAVEFESDPLPPVAESLVVPGPPVLVGSGAVVDVSCIVDEKPEPLADVVPSSLQPPAISATTAKRYP